MESSPPFKVEEELIFITINHFSISHNFITTLEGVVAWPQTGSQITRHLDVGQRRASN